MAVPRIFISSTFYDLRQLREDIDFFIRDLGYEPIRHETGSIPYGNDLPLDQYAYNEVGLADVVICVIGGRFGSDSSESTAASITQHELEYAIKKGIQVFIFIESKVATEFETYKENQGNHSIRYRHADNPKVYSFIEKLHALPNNNPISTFDTSRDIIDYLKAQFAGLFQRYLTDRRQDRQFGHWIH